MSEAVEIPKEQDLDTSWMENMGEWGVNATPGKRGLTLADIQVGSYGELPEDSDNMTGRPRGAAVRPEAYRVGAYSVHTLSEIWLDNAEYLYEEALQRQWSSATDIPWHTLEPLPDDVEEAECFLCTFFNEVEFVAGDVPARWIAKTTPDYLEARNVLVVQVMDEARHMDVFRKRALANGGGLMRMSGATSGFVGSIDLARDFTEMSTRLHICSAWENSLVKMKLKKPCIDYVLRMKHDMWHSVLCICVTWLQQSRSVVKKLTVISMKPKDN